MRRYFFVMLKNQHEPWTFETRKIILLTKGFSHNKSFRAPVGSSCVFLFAVHKIINKFYKIKNSRGFHVRPDFLPTNRPNITVDEKFFKYLISSKLFVSFWTPNIPEHQFQWSTGVVFLNITLFFIHFSLPSIQMKRNCQRKCLFRKSMKAVRDCSIFRSLPV